MQSAEAALLRVKYDDENYEDGQLPGIRTATEAELRDILFLLEDDDLTFVPDRQLREMLDWARDKDSQFTAQDLILWLLDRRMWIIGKDPVDGEENRKPRTSP